MSVDLELPGGDLVGRGLIELRSGQSTVAALLVVIGAPRLRGLGIDVPPSPRYAEGPELELYRLLWSEDPDRAHSRYNALIRELVSFERALEHRLRRRALNLDAPTPFSAQDIGTGVGGPGSHPGAKA